MRRRTDSNRLVRLFVAKMLRILILAVSSVPEIHILYCEASFSLNLSNFRPEPHAPRNDQDPMHNSNTQCFVEIRSGIVARVMRGNDVEFTLETTGAPDYYSSIWEDYHPYQGPLK